MARHLHVVLVWGTSPLTREGSEVKGLVLQTKKLVLCRST